MAQPNGSPNGNSSPNQNFTAAQIAAFVNGSVSNLINTVVQRNPGTAYSFITLNYPGIFPLIANKGWANAAVMESMIAFLEKQYSLVPAAQQAAWLYALCDSVPDKAELQNWTTPVTTPTVSTTVKTLK